MFDVMLVRFCVALLVCLCVTVAVDTSLLPDTTEAICTSAQYYSPTSLSCKACDSTGSLNKIPDTGNVDVNGNYYSCECELGFRRTEDDCSTVQRLSYFLFNA